MNPFKTRKPRRFNHPLIYSDERSRRLRLLEEKARRELGMTAPEPFNAEFIRGAFTGDKSPLCRHRKCEKNMRLSSVSILLLIVALAWLMHYLMSGNWLI